MTKETKKNDDVGRRRGKEKKSTTSKGTTNEDAERGKNDDVDSDDRNDDVESDEENDEKRQRRKRQKNDVESDEKTTTSKATKKNDFRCFRVSTSSYFRWFRRRFFRFRRLTPEETIRDAEPWHFRTTPAPGNFFLYGSGSGSGSGSGQNVPAPTAPAPAPAPMSQNQGKSPERQYYILISEDSNVKILSLSNLILTLNTSKWLLTRQNRSKN